MNRFFLLASSLSFLALSGCIALYPITEYTPVTAAGTVRTSGCVGFKSVQHQIDGVTLVITMRGDGSDTSPAWFYMYITPQNGRSVRTIPAVVRIKPLDERPEALHPIDRWERNILRLKGTKRLEHVVVEWVAGNELMIGKIPNDDGTIFGETTKKTFSAHISLKELPADGYLVQLPSLEIDGQLHHLAPIEYKRNYRIEWMVPLNC